MKNFLSRIFQLRKTQIYDFNPHLQDEEAHCIAVHSYTSENPDDLTFNEGDRITLLLRLGPDWLKGKIGDKSGMFPANFVKIIKDVESK